MPRRIQYTTSSEREREEKGFRVCQAGIPQIVRLYNVDTDFGRKIIKKIVDFNAKMGEKRVGDDERKKLEMLLLSLEHKRVTGKRLVARTRLWGETGAKRSETNFAPRPKSRVLGRSNTPPETWDKFGAQETFQVSPRKQQPPPRSEGV